MKCLEVESQGPLNKRHCDTFLQAHRLICTVMELSCTWHGPSRLGRLHELQGDHAASHVVPHQACSEHPHEQIYNSLPKKPAESVVIQQQNLCTGLDIC